MFEVGPRPSIPAAGSAQFSFAATGTPAPVAVLPPWQRQVEATQTLLFWLVPTDSGMILEIEAEGERARRMAVVEGDLHEIGRALGQLAEEFLG